MTPTRTIGDLENFLDLLLDSSIALGTTKVVVQRNHGGFQRVTWANNAAVPGNLFRVDSSTIAEYRDWVNCHGYSALLYDGSFLQISYDFEHSEMVGHRLLFFPCPFDLELEFLNEIPLSELIDLHANQRAETVQLRTPVRFDYDPNAGSQDHPVSHLTFQWPCSRIPVYAPVSPGFFIQFVFKNFYPALWKAHLFLRKWPRDALEPTITSEERRFLHVNSYP